MTGVTKDSVRNYYADGLQFIIDVYHQLTPDPLDKVPVEKNFLLRIVDMLRTIPDKVSVWKHKKNNNTVYFLLKEAKIQISTKPLVDGDAVYVYQDEFGNWWVRGKDEFLDGRFTLILEKGA